MSVIEEIAAERRRQIEAEGWTAERDDDYQQRELANAAAAYALFAGLETEARDTHVGHLHHPLGDMESAVAAAWPWGCEWFKPSNPRRELIKAAALIVAEIERLDRKAIP